MNNCVAVVVVGAAVVKSRLRIWSRSEIEPCATATNEVRHTLLNTTLGLGLELTVSGFPISFFLCFKARNPDAYFCSRGDIRMKVSPWNTRGRLARKFSTPSFAPHPHRASSGKSNARPLGMVLAPDNSLFALLFTCFLRFSSVITDDDRLQQSQVYSLELYSYAVIEHEGALLPYLWHLKAYHLGGCGGCPWLASPCERVRCHVLPKNITD